MLQSIRSWRSASMLHRTFPARLFSSSSTPTRPSHVSVNGLKYRVPQPGSNLVGVVIDGGSEEYLDAARRAGRMPFLSRLLTATHDASSAPSSFILPRSPGFHALVTAQMPSLTNPNNVSMVTGVPASIHGICGNYFLDENEHPPVERLMNSSEFMRAETVFEVMQREAQAQIIILTAKDKLLSLLSKGLDLQSDRTLAFSIEKLGSAAQSHSNTAAASSSSPSTSNSPLDRLLSLTGRPLTDLSQPFFDYFSKGNTSSGHANALLSELSSADRSALERGEVPSIYNPLISLYLLELGLQIWKTLHEQDIMTILAATAVARALRPSGSSSDQEKEDAIFAAAESAIASIPPRLFYLSTTDFLQHKYLPDYPASLDFYAYIDSIIQRFTESRQQQQAAAHSALRDTLPFDIDQALPRTHLAMTADHGMNSKVGFDGTPKVVYVEQVLAGAGIRNRTILPITDPYVKHHGSLGGYATVYLEDKSADHVLSALKLLRSQPGVYTALDRNEACKAFDLPPDRVGDIVVLGDASTVLGKTPEHHDLSQVPHLRSHGGLDEATIPLVTNTRLQKAMERRLTRGQARNYHLWDILCNGTMEENDGNE